MSGQKHFSVYSQQGSRTDGNRPLWWEAVPSLTWEKELLSKNFQTLPIVWSKNQCIHMSKRVALHQICLEKPTGTFTAEDLYPGSVLSEGPCLDCQDVRRSWRTSPSVFSRSHSAPSRFKKKKGWSSFLGCLGWAVAEVKQSRRPHTEHAVKLHPSSRLFGVRGGKEVRSFQHCSSSYLLWLQSAIMWTHVGPFRNCHMEAAVRHTEQVREVWRNHETAGSSFKIQVC